MSVERFSLDANVFFYAIDAIDASDVDRHRRATEVVERAALEYDCIVALQAYGEFFAGSTRKGKMTMEEAGAQVADWQTLFPTVYPGPGSLNQAIDAVVDHHRGGGQLAPLRGGVGEDLLEGIELVGGAKEGDRVRVHRRGSKVGLKCS